jgi:uncharacterized protein YjdB
MKTNNLLIIVLTTILFFGSCKKDEPITEENESSGAVTASTDKVLFIEQGNNSIIPGQTLSYSSIYVKIDGTTQVPSSVSWSVSDNSIATINSSGVLTASGIGTAKVIAQSGGDITEVLIKVGADYPFLVLPGVYSGFSGETVQLETVYLGSQNPTYTYSSTDNNVLTVNSSGLVNLVSAGNAVIEVTSSLYPNNLFPVSILVWGSINISLPITRVKVNPSSKDMFRGDNVSLSATAYDINNNVVSTSFSWASLDANVATVNASGQVTAVSIGETKIKATAQGMVGFCDILVSPDTIVIVTPFSASVAPGDTKQFTAQAYNARTNSVITSITNFSWDIPTYGMSIFDIATVNSSGLVTMKSSAQLGLMTFISASVIGNPNAMGAAGLSVGMALNCGPGNSSVNSIAVSNGSSVTLSLFGGPVTLNATGKDVSNNTVASPALKFNSDDTNIVNVDEDSGELFPLSPGSATITICSGNYANSTVTVTVQ